MGVKLVKHPKTGEEMVPVSTGMKMLSGKRVAASRVKSDEHGGDKALVKEGFEKAATALDMTGRSNTKAGLDVEMEKFRNCFELGFLGIILTVGVMRPRALGTRDITGIKDRCMHKLTLLIRCVVALKVLL